MSPEYDLLPSKNILEFHCVQHIGDVFLLFQHLVCYKHVCGRACYK